MALLSSEEWLRVLRSRGVEQEKALAILRGGLLRALKGYLTERRSVWGYDQEQVSELAEDLAQDALLNILEKLDTFRGESQFTTWAYAVALRRALGELRRKHWQERSVAAPEGSRQLPIWPLEDQRSHNPEQVAQQSELWQAIHRVIEQDLTVRQRTVLVGHVFQGVPLDILAEQLGTNRDNIYKILHDARKKLKQRLLQRGLTYGDILKAFEPI